MLGAQNRTDAEIVVLTKWKLYLIIGTMLVSIISQASVAWYRSSDHEVRIQTLESDRLELKTLKTAIQSLEGTIGRLENRIDGTLKDVDGKLQKKDDQILELWRRNK